MIVGRGKVCYKHSGNAHLVKIVKSVINVYATQKATKKSKTELIKSIVSQVRESSPDGGFVKFDVKGGKWYEVGDNVAREKVSQTFRDALTDQYKSSTTSKTLKRRQERINRQSSVGSTDSTSTTYSDISSSPQQRAAIVAAAPQASRALSPFASPLMPSLTSLVYQSDLGLMGDASTRNLKLALAIEEKKRTLKNLFFVTQLRNQPTAGAFKLNQY